jgi:DNA-binding NtrC family response regulator
MSAFFDALRFECKIRTALVATVLIVEDDFLIRELSEMTIQDWGYHTLSAGDADEALQILRSSAEIDVLFTDIYLKNGVLDGCELAQKAVEIRPTLRVLYTTGNSLTAKLKSLFIEGAPCLVKPYTPGQLESCLERLLDLKLANENPVDRSVI